MPNELLHDSHQRERTKARPGVPETRRPRRWSLAVAMIAIKIAGQGGDEPRLRYLSHERQKQISRESSLKRLST